MTTKLEQSRLIFVGGAPRSGTTLVQRILGAHSQVYAGPEFDLVPQIMELRNQFLQKIEAGRISTYLDAQATNDVFERFILAIFQKKASKTNKSYLSEKTPSNIEVFPELQDCLPNAKYIFVVRDPRAIVASLLEVGRKMRADSIDAPAYLRRTRYAVEFVNMMWEKGRQALLKDHVLLLHYEDIISDTESTVRKLSAFVGIPFEEAMLQIQSSKWDAPEFKAGEAYWYTKEQLEMAISKQSTEKWKENLSAYDLYLIDHKLKRIPEITGRYSFEVSSSLPWGAVDLFERILIQLRRHAGRMVRLVMS